MDARLERFIRQMPKVELHLHLEGTVRPTTVLELARQHGIALPVRDLTELAQWFHFRSFRHFLDIWLAVLACLRTEADFARITRELGETAGAQHVRYLEAIFTPTTHERCKGMTHDEVWAGIRDGARSAARDHGVRCASSSTFPAA